MQAAFPIFGIIALAAILVDVGEKVIKLTSDFDGLRKMEDETWKQILIDQQEDIAATKQHQELIRDTAVAMAELHGDKAGRSQRGQEAGAGIDLQRAKDDLQSYNDKLHITQTTIEKLRPSRYPAKGD